MSFLDFNGPEPKGKMDLMPNGALCWAYLAVREIKHSQNTGGRMFDVELTVDAPAEFARKKLWTYIMDPSDMLHSEDARTMGYGALRRILECTGFLPQYADQMKAETPEQAEQLVRHIATVIDGKRVAIKVKIEKGKDGYQDKNAVGDWLSPNPESSSYKAFQQLQTPPAAVGTGFAGTPASGGFGGARQPAPAGGGFGAPRPQAAPAPGPSFGTPAPGFLPPGAGQAAPSPGSTSTPATAAAPETQTADATARGAFPSEAAKVGHGSGPSWLTAGGQTA